MTLSIAWIRSIGYGAEELVFASDSRLCGGLRFDEACKMLIMPGRNSILAFAGLTYWAYPMMLAAVQAIEAHRPARSGSMRVAKLKTHIITILTELQKHIHTYAAGENLPEVESLFGGYDWHRKEFLLWRIQFDSRRGVFSVANSNARGFARFGKICFAGDKTWVTEAQHRLRKKMQAKYGRTIDTPDNAAFNMEPFEVLCSLLEEIKPEDTIGGAPQLAKVYQHMNADTQAVFWPNRQQGTIYLTGRQLLSYENVDVWVINPETLRSEDAHIFLHGNRGN